MSYSDKQKQFALQMQRFFMRGEYVAPLSFLRETISLLGVTAENKISVLFNKDYYSVLRFKIPRGTVVGINKEALSIDSLSLYKNRIKWYGFDSLKKDHKYYFDVIVGMAFFHGTYKPLLEKMGRFPELDLNMGIGFVPMNSDHESVKEGLVIPSSGPVSPEDYMKGFSSNILTDSIYGAFKDGKILTPNALTKYLARMKISYFNNPKIVGIPVRVSIILDASDEEVRDYFVCGNVYATDDWIEKFGICRIVSSSGLKATTAPIGKLESIQGVLSRMDSMTLLGSSGAFKSGARGLYQVLSGSSFLEAMEASNEDVLDLISEHTLVSEFNGVSVSYVSFETEVDITNLYSLDGWQFKDEMLVEDENGNVTASNSGYQTKLIEEYLKDDSVSLIEMLMSDIEEGVVEFKKGITSISMMDMLNMKFTYGNDSVSALLNSGKVWSRNSSWHLHFSSTEEAVNNISERDFLVITNEIYKDFAVKRVPLGGISPSHMSGETEADRKAAYDKALNILLNGMTKTVNGVSHTWYGLKQPGDTSIECRGHKFIIPAWHVIEKDLMPANGEDYSDGVYFSGVMQAFASLVIAVRNPKTDWRRKHYAHNAVIQSAVFPRNIDAVSARGAYFVALPLVTNKEDFVVCTSKIAKRGMMSYSKMPVLFNNAFREVEVSKSLGPIFGNELVSDVMKFAIECAAFVDVDTLIRQGNDCDGDMVRLTDTACMSVEDKENFVDVGKKYWDTYVAEEYELDILSKSLNVKEIKLEENTFPDALNEAIVAKTGIGPMTTNMVKAMFVLEEMISEDAIDEISAMYIKEAYALAMQDDYVRAIKHEHGEPSIDPLYTLRSKDASPTAYANSLIFTIKNKVGAVMSTEDEVAVVDFARRYGDLILFTTYSLADTIYGPMSVENKLMQLSGCEKINRDSFKLMFINSWYNKAEYNLTKAEFGLIDYLSVEAHYWHMFNKVGTGSKYQEKGVFNGTCVTDMMYNFAHFNWASKDEEVNKEQLDVATKTEININDEEIYGV